ncbi:hypothetical protein H9Q69_003700 [Fusarium xylarioides]|nr:hypothetical protein H9Q69_003700 [Fusarium xylarioides]
MIPLRHRNNRSHREDQIRSRCRIHSPSRTSRSQTGGSQNRGQDRGAGRQSQRRSRSPRRSPVASNRNTTVASNRNTSAFRRASRPTGITMDLGREAGGRDLVEPRNDAQSFMENEEELVRVISSSGQIRRGTIAARGEPSRANFVETQNSGLVQELRAQISQAIQEKDEAVNSERHKDELIKELSEKNNELSDIVKFQECHILDLHQEIREKDKALEAERVKSQSLEARLSEFRR